MSFDAAPLVTVIVRSVDRPQLARALASLARQTCAALDIVVVDATGGRHRRLPDVQLRDGHSLRFIASPHALSPAQAANTGIDAARGELFSFLDDDDTCEPQHLATLLDAAAAHPDKVLVYGRTRVIGPDGRLQRVIGGPFNRALLYCGPLVCWQAALIRARVRDLGVRVDESLSIYEDRDYLAQVAAHSDFGYVPAATFEHHLAAGASGRAAARDGIAALRSEARVRARWSGPAAHHLERVMLRCRRAEALRRCGERDEARRLFVRVLEEYPRDPDALHGLARVQIEEGALDDAEASVRAAIDLDGGTPPLHLTLATILHARGDAAAADIAAAVAAREPSLAQDAMTLRARIAGSTGGRAAEQVSRNAACACGSGRRYKACCGRLRTPAAASVLHDPRSARYLEFERLCRPLAARSAYATVRQLLGRDAAIGGDGRATPIHVITSLAGLGGTEARALALYEVLVPHGDVTLWSVDSPDPRYAHRAPIHTIDSERGHVPDGGTLVFVGTFFEYGDWLQDARARRVVICYNIELPTQLVQRVTQIREVLPAVPLELTFPTRRFRDHTGLPGRVELMPLDLTAFTAIERAASCARRLVVGRHSRDDADKHHPGDPRLYGALLARGHRVRILGGMPLAAALASDRARGDVELLRAGSEAPTAFLRTLDCFLYRKHPSWYETGGIVILEAMASGLPVVVFDEGCGGVEWIVHGSSGFVVSTAQEALGIIERLAQEPDLRRRIGDAARRQAVALMTRARRDTPAVYLGDDGPDFVTRNATRSAAVTPRQVPERPIGAP